MGWSGNVRVLPVGGGARSGSVGSPVNAAGRRYYQGTDGTTLDVIAEDANVLHSQGFFSVAASGRTADRPNDTNLAPGFWYIDTDLALLIVFDGKTFRNPVTGAAV